MADPLLDVQNLSVAFEGPSHTVAAVKDVELPHRSR